MIKEYLFSIPLRMRFLAIVVNLLITSAVVVSSLLATPIYRSEALLIPKSAFSSSPADLGGGAQAALIGLGLSGSVSKLSPFEAISKSPAVIDKFIDKSGLRNAVSKKYIEDYRDLFSNIVKIDFRKDGTVAISVEDKAPSMAQKYALAYVEAFEEVTKIIAQRNAKAQAESLTTIVEHARSTYDTTQSRVKNSRIDKSLVRNDPTALATALTDIEGKILKSRTILAQLEQTLAPGNPEMLSAQVAHKQLLAAREQLLQASPSSDNSGFSIDIMLARQSATILGVYTQAREKMLVDSMLSSLPYTLAQPPTLPEKRIRPQRRKMISFAVMTQAIVNIALLGVHMFLQRRGSTLGPV